MQPVHAFAVLAVMPFGCGASLPPAKHAATAGDIDGPARPVS